MNMVRWRVSPLWKTWLKKLSGRVATTESRWRPTWFAMLPRITNPPSGSRTTCGNNGKPLAPDVVREPDGGLVMRGSMAIDAVEELLGVHFGEQADETVTTLAGLLSHVTGKVPASGDRIDIEGHRFEVTEANQRKVLRVRIRKQMKAVPTKK